MVLHLARDNGKLITENGVLMGIQTSSDHSGLKKSWASSDQKERELNELRTNLVSTISHEFRTPMTTFELVQN
jgi:signal transduction histidine kinase